MKKCVYRPAILFVADLVIILFASSPGITATTVENQGVRVVMLPVGDFVENGQHILVAKLKFKNTMNMTVSSIIATASPSESIEVSPKSVSLPRLEAYSEGIANDQIKITSPQRYSQDKMNRALSWKVTCVPTASVQSPMPTDAASSISQSIHVTVKNHKGENVSKFRYDNDPLLPLWHDKIYVRSNDSELFKPDIAAFAGRSYVEPHAYSTIEPRIFIEIYQQDTLVDSDYSDVRDTFLVSSPGLYRVRCSTTFQLNGEIAVEQTDVPFGGTMVPPSFTEGTDDKGQYEFYRIEQFESAGQRLAYKYYKRYTYQVITSTITYVSPGESDGAMVCILQDTDALGRLAGGTMDDNKAVWSPSGLPDSEYLTNLAARTTIKEGIAWAIRNGQTLVSNAAAQGLLASEVATVIYAGVSPEEDVNVEQLVASGLRWGATYLICLKLGVTTGTAPAVIIGVVGTAVSDFVWNAYHLQQLADAVTSACRDDIEVQRVYNGSTYDVYLFNRGAPLKNVRLATYYEGLAVPNDLYGVSETLPTGNTYIFRNVPAEWFETRSAGPITSGTLWPMVTFEEDLLSHYRQITLDVNYDDLIKSSILRTADIIFCIDTTSSMRDDISAVKTASVAIINQIASDMPDFRIAVVDYRDFPTSPYGGSGDYPYHDVLRFTASKTDAINAIQSLSLGWGNDTNESVYSALIHCIESTSLGSWRGQPVKKTIILMGDAPPHEPEPFTGYTMAQVNRAAEDADPVTFYPVVVGGDSTTTAYFSGLAEGTGGQVFTAANAAEVVEAILDAINAVAYSPFAEANGPYSGTVGEVIVFSAAGSYDRDGNIVLYEWDWNNDGIYDQTTTASSCEHSWASEYTGRIRLRVTDNASMSSIDTAEVSIVTPSNKPPVANAGSDQTVEKMEVAGAEVHLDGSGSSDPDGDALTYQWTWSGGTASGISSIITLPMGLTRLTLTVSDGKLSSTDTVDVTVVDTTGPSVAVTEPQVDMAIQDKQTLCATATDLSEIDGVYFCVRQADDGNGIPAGKEDIAAAFNSTIGKWEVGFDTTMLQDGYYVVFAKGVDIYGNAGWSAGIPFSIRNWAVIAMLPSTPNSNAGRMMPVKFSLRVTKSVDAMMPFVYNDELEIRIFDKQKPGTILQRSQFGEGSTNYRIDLTTKMYMTDFKTGKSPATYVVEVWRPEASFKIGSFTFTTVK